VKSRKIEIMKTTPEFTEAEIQEMMDFSQVLSLTEAAHRRNKRIVRGIITTALITGLVGGSLFVYQQYSSSESSTLPTDNVGTSTTPPNTAPENAVALDTSLHKASRAQARVPIKKPVQKAGTEERKNETEFVIRIDSARSVFIPAEPTSGYDALYEYFAKELHYPPEAIKDSIQGVILVSFVINTEGMPERVETDHMLGEVFEKEAIRLIEQMPVWKPALLDGSPVNSKVSVPITFTVKTIRQ
jgi:TonB family protein